MSDVSISVEQLKKIIDAGLAINETYENFDVVLQKILHAGEFTLDCEAVSYMEYDSKSKDLIFRVASGRHAHSLAGLRIPSGQGIAHKVLQERKGIVVNDVKKVQEHYADIDKSLSYVTRNLLAFPLFDRDKKPFGVIEACNKRDNEKFSKEDFQLFALMCQQIEQSLRNASQINDLKNTIEEIYESDLFVPPFVCASKEMRVKLTLAKKISQSSSPILISGESGCGKRLLAHHIHKWNAMLSGFPVEIICHDLVKGSEGNAREIHRILFGENRRKMRTGLMFASSNKSIIFSEVWKLPLQTQRDILQYLKHKTVTYAGEDSLFDVSDRVIFTSSQDLEILVSENKFLEELYFHINALHIHIPRLHKRPDDITAIAEHYFAKFISEFQKDIRQVDPDVYVLLKKYGWPHSVRELIETVYRSVLCCETQTLTRDDILFNSQVNLGAAAQEDAKDLVTLKEAIDDFKKKYIYHALLRNNWNCTKTANILEIQRSYLSRLVKSFNLKNLREQKK